MGKTIVVVGIGLALLASTPCLAQSRTLDAFVTEANRIPLNPTSAIRSDARRLVREFNASMTTVSAEVRDARAAGRTPPACPPERIQMNPRQLLDYLNAIPQTRRQRMTPTDGIRSWLASRYPCPAA
ncbi:hypothetical protein IP78_07255 [Brevundimonas sp. AAP58]|uniref:hypothetical protein n=1 Tax=Brevundimonas sp. AAP58 TaxID=1523422 RepID=UPI0006BA0C3F|nr:hypothetical protein [Brevundimonas sp. AAP58]KPF80395.1 hypothetical protein IP78_07255 [Brevundimonas sp. AAP58]